MTESELEIAERLAAASERAYRRGIQTGSGGNVSARLPGTDTMLAKASGGSLGDCAPESFLITDFDGNLIEGTGKSARKALLHGYIYRMRQDANAVVHVHAPYAIGWSSSKRDLPRTRTAAAGDAGAILWKGGEAGGAEAAIPARAFPRQPRGR